MQAAKRARQAVEALLAFLLLGMVVMVFGNVVLRYAANSGILVSEELSRFFFVWLTFIGAILAMAEGAHLGMDNVVRKLPRKGKLACLVVSQVLILMCCAMVLWGTWRQHGINASMHAPVTGMSMIWIFGLGYVCSVSMGGLAALRLVQAVRGRLADEDLVDLREGEAPRAPVHA